MQKDVIMFRRLIGSAAILSVCASCSDSRARLPTAPTPLIAVPPASPSAPQNATPIVLGQTMAQVITAADPPCGIELPPEPPEPCHRFAVSPTSAGVLKVRLTSQGPNELTLRFASRFYWGTAVEASASVESGPTYEIAVALHGGKGSQPFELRATLEPF